MKKDVKMLAAQTKREANEAFGMEEDAIENRKLFWKEIKNVRN